MKPLRILLMFANTGAAAVLMAIPTGKLLGVVTTEVDAAAVFGWLIFFVPLLASALALWGTQSSRFARMRRFVVVSMPGSFLLAFLSLFTYWKGPAEFAPIGIGLTILLALNVVALWEPFRSHIATSVPQLAEGDEDEYNG